MDELFVVDFHLLHRHREPPLEMGAGADAPTREGDSEYKYLNW
jgi:hypothetical protein